MNKKVAKFLKMFSIYCGIILAAFLSVLTFFFTTKMGECHTGETQINIAPYIILSVIIFLALFSCKPIFRRLEKINTKTIAKVALLWGVIASLVWVFIADAFPMWDSYDLVLAAEALNGIRGPAQMNEWAPGSYMERYPYQTPIALVILMCMKFAGTNYIVLFEILNCLASGLTMYLIIRYTHLLFKNKTLASASAVLVMLFAPLVIYATFIYGNLLCIPFALLCLIWQKKGLDAKKSKKRVLYIVASIIAGAIAVILKKPIIVVVIAAAIVYIVWGIQNRKFQFIAVALIGAIVANYAIFPINAFVESKTHTNLHNGNPMITWIAMGIGASSEYYADENGDEELRNNTHLAGYYDLYPWITPGGTYSPESIKETSIEYIKKRIGHFASDPGLFFGFFANKIIVDWTEPTYESLLASNWTDYNNPDGNNLCGRNYTALARSFYYGKANAVLLFGLDTLQSVIVVGFLACLIKLRKKIDITQMGAFLAVLGLFVIYLFWETKTQYIFPAYLFMIPFSAMGLVTIAKKIQKLQIIKKVDKLWKRH